MEKKIAVFHQFLDNIGGAEILTLTLARELGADVYTTNIDAEKISLVGFKDLLPRIHSIGKIPIKAPFRHQAALWRFSRLKLKDRYDFFIISGDWAISGAKHNSPNLWYIHSPARELWDLKSYVRKDIVKGFFAKIIFDLWVGCNRILHRRYINTIERFACNSENTKKRVKKFLNRDATVIYPPIDTRSYSSLPHKNYWLSVNRLLKHKRVEIQIEAFKMLPQEKLIIVGSYEKNARQFEDYKKELEKIQPSNVEIRHFVSDKELKKLYAECKGFITTAKDEDFGMTVIEAQASGKPVIAGDEGGYKETILDGKTGTLIRDIDALTLAKAIKKMGLEIQNEPLKYQDVSIAQARKFDIALFIQNIKDKIITY